MSKRKNRTSGANLPQETLERARRQAAIDRGELPPEPEPVVEAPVVERPKPTSLAPGVNPYVTTPASQRRAVSAARTGTRRARGMQTVGASGRKPELDAETISQLLENPTIEVTEAELRRDYQYVVADLRNMFTLAAGLVVTLVLLATLLPR